MRTNHHSFIALVLAFKVTFLLSTIFDIVVFILTVIRTFQIVREHRKCGARAYLPKLLMRDGKLLLLPSSVKNVNNALFLSRCVVYRQHILRVSSPYKIIIYLELIDCSNSSVMVIANVINIIFFTVSSNVIKRICVLKLTIV